MKRENRRASTREKLGAGLIQQRNYKKIGKERKKKNKRMHQLGKHVLFREDDVESGKRMEAEGRKGRSEVGKEERKKVRYLVIIITTSYLLGT